METELAKYAYLMTENKSERWKNIPWLQQIHSQNGRAFNFMGEFCFWWVL